MDKIRKIFILLYGLAIGMQVQQVPDREPLPRGTQHCDHCSRKTDRVKDLLASAALVYGIVPADKDVDAAQVERQVAPVPLPGGQHGNDQHGFICQQQNRNAPQDAPPGAFRAAAVPAGCQQDADCNCCQLRPVDRPE